MKRAFPYNKETPFSIREKRLLIFPIKYSPSLRGAGGSSIYAL
ncbi:hypothetical protein HMPREF0973_00852 [Prevotella veroralis F0319]|uniref:Uncharacterized protein n=1 Tax=Prevotella veroralis F0319 TaxID=649761 RepID=C9MMM0_9BACT|nr:hypothetical protein HMPREF0973_00852 [Prevotella veroralis F0319]